MPGDVADDSYAHSVSDESLDDLAGNSRAEAEEVLVEALDGNHQQARAIFPHRRDQLDGVAVIAQRRRAFQDSDNEKFVA